MLQYNKYILYINGGGHRRCWKCSNPVVDTGVGVGGDIVITGGDGCANNAGTLDGWGDTGDIITRAG